MTCFLWSFVVLRNFHPMLLREESPITLQLQVQEKLDNHMLLTKVRRLEKNLEEAQQSKSASVAESKEEQANSNDGNEKEMDELGEEEEEEEEEEIEFDGVCKSGKQNGDVCCHARCKSCGGDNCGGFYHRSKRECCLKWVRKFYNRPCGKGVSPPCIIVPKDSVNSPIANKAETAKVLPQAFKTKDSEAGGSLRSNTRGVIIDQSTTDDDDGDGDDDEARITKTKETETRASKTKEPEAQASKTKEPEPRTALRSNTRGIINVQSTTDDYDDDDEGAATVTMAKTAKALAARIKMPEEHAVKTKEPGTQAAKTKDPDAQEASKGQLAKTSTRLQTMAQDAALRAIKTHRNGVDSNLCVTTLDVNELSVDERKFLLFSAPPPLEEMPNSMLSWHKALQGRGDDRPLGTFVVIANDLKTRQLCNEHGIPTMCTEHSEEGLPILDRMLLRMHESLPDTAGIVGYVNSDITARNLKGLDQLFEKLQDTALEVQQTPEQIYLPFNATGKKSDNWFAVAT